MTALAGGDRQEWSEWASVRQHPYRQIGFSHSDMVHRDNRHARSSVQAGFLQHDLVQFDACGWHPPDSVTMLATARAAQCVLAFRKYNKTDAHACTSSSTVRVGSARQLNVTPNLQPVRSGLASRFPRHAGVTDWQLRSWPVLWILSSSWLGMVLLHPNSAD